MQGARVQRVQGKGTEGSGPGYRGRGTVVRGSQVPMEEDGEGTATPWTRPHHRVPDCGHLPHLHQEYRSGWRAIKNCKITPSIICSIITPSIKCAWSANTLQKVKCVPGQQIHTVLYGGGFRVHKCMFLNIAFLRTVFYTPVLHTYQALQLCTLDPEHEP